MSEFLRSSRTYKSEINAQSAKRSKELEMPEVGLSKAHIF